MTSIRIPTPYEGKHQNKTMENQENVVKPQSPLSFTGVLREAFKTTRRNGKLVLSILLLVILSSSQLELGSNLALKPILKNFVSHFQTTSGYENQKPRSFENPRPSQWVDQNKYTHNRDVPRTSMVPHIHPSSGLIQDTLYYMGEPLSKSQMKDFRDFLGVELLILVVSCVISLFFLVSAISSSYEAHTAKVMSLKDVFLKFKQSWKRPIHTSFCLVLISLGLFTLFAIFTGVIPLIAQGSCVILLYGILIITAFFTYFHMAVRWILSLVVSVLETESSGLKAIDRAGELMKGKKFQALGLMLLFHFAMGAVHQISGALTNNLQGYTKMAVSIPFNIGLICMLKLFMFVVYTVYYHERKMSRKEEGVKGQLGLYVPIVTDEA